MNINPLSSKWLSLALLVVVGCLVFALLGINNRRAEFRQAVADMEQKVAEAEKSKTYLEKFIAYFRSPQFLEKQARAKLNYKTPGEEVAFVFKDPNPTPSVDSVKVRSSAPNYQKWWYYVLGY